MRPEPLPLLLDRVVDLVALADRARVDAEVRQLAERVRDDLERQCGERRLVVCLAGDDLVAAQVGALRRRDVERAGQVVDDRVEHRLDALVLERRPGQHGHEVARQRAEADHLLQLGLGQRLVGQVLLEHLVVLAGDRLEQAVTPVVGLGLLVGGDVLLVVGGALVVAVPDDRLHLDEVDDAPEAALRADRQLDDGRHGFQPALDHLDGAEEVGAGAVHLVDEAHARHAVAVGLPPDGLGLRLDAGDGVEDGDGAVEHAERALDLDREIDVAGRVDDVDAVVVPEGGRGGRRDGDAALLLLGHVVHDGGAFVDLTDLVGLAGVVEDPLGRRGLARVDVSHDPDVAIALEGKLTLGHSRSLSTSL